MEQIDPSCVKFVSDEYGSSAVLFGDEFQSTLEGKVKKDTALSQAVSITKRSQKTRDTGGPCSRSDSKNSGQFFRRGLPIYPVRGQAGQVHTTIHTVQLPVQAGSPGFWERMLPIRLPDRPKVPRTEAPPKGVQSPNYQEILRLLGSLPDTNLGDLGIAFDWELVARESCRPVGGRLQFFKQNWERISQDR